MSTSGRRTQTTDATAGADAPSVPRPAAGRSVTILDVAERAGVSKTTASDALSGSGRVSAATRSRISAVAAELGYVPNTAARHLRRGRVGSIGLYIPRRVMSLTFYMELAFAAARRAQEHDMDLTLLAQTPRATGALQLRSDALIIVEPLADDPVAANLLSANVPIVTAGGPRGATPAPVGVLHSDFVTVTHQLLDHLRDAGADRIAYIAPEHFLSEWAMLTRATYEQWCRDHGRTPHVRGVPTTYTPKEVGDAVHDLLTGCPDIDALVCGPDGTALSTLPVLQNMGRRVGQDILLAACVDSPSLQLSNPPITAIDLNPANYGIAAVDLLVDFLDGSAAPPLERPNPADLHVRASTSSSALPAARARRTGPPDPARSR